MRLSNAVTDAAPIDPPNELRIATRYLWYSVGWSAFNIIVDVAELFIGESRDIPVFALLGIGLLSWLTYNISRGRNWARIALVVYFLLFSPLLFLLHATVFGVIAIFAMLLLQVLALYRVFAGAGATWFRRPKDAVGVRMGRTEKAVTTVGVLAVTALAVAAFVTLSKRSITNQLAEVSRQMNATLPKMIDAETRLDETAVIDGGLQSHYTLVNYAAKEIDQADFRKRVQPKLVGVFCKSEQIRAFRAANVPFSYAYFGNDGEHIVTILVAAPLCER